MNIPATKNYFIGTQLLDYKQALLKAFEIGQKIKAEGFIPPKITLEFDGTEFLGKAVIGLDVNGNYGRCASPRNK
jgi:hypothetical protein